VNKRKGRGIILGLPSMLMLLKISQPMFAKSSEYDIFFKSSVDTCLHCTGL
jgi:hypothetical protein